MVRFVHFLALVINKKSFHIQPCHAVAICSHGPRTVAPHLRLFGTLTEQKRTSDDLSLATLTPLMPYPTPKEA